MSNTATDNWNAHLYDGKHAFVSEYGNDLFRMLDPKPGQRILDLGCGTGDLTKQIHDADADVTGVDASKQMISQARQKYPSIAFEVSDASSLNYKNEFDSVFSNAVLHWIKTPEKVLQGVYNSLKDNGSFIAEFGGKGNVRKITSEIQTQLQNLGLPYDKANFPWYFPSIGEYTTLMEAAGFRVVFASHFDRPTPLKGEDGLKNWIEMFGNMMFKGLDQKAIQTVITNTENKLKKTMFNEDQWIADYKRIRIIGVK